MGPRVVRIDGERLHGRLAGRGERLLLGLGADGHLVDGVARQLRPRRRVPGIDREHPAQKHVRLRETLRGSLPCELDGLEVERVGLGIGRARLGRRAEQRDLELLDHVGGDLVLDREDVVELAVVGLRPKVRVGAGLDQLRRDPHRVARLAHRAFEHVRHVQRPRDLRNRNLLALERERRRARRHLQLRNLRQQVQQLLRDAVGEVLLALVRTEIREREDGDRRAGCCRRDQCDRSRGSAREQDGRRDAEQHDHGGCDREERPMLGRLRRGNLVRAAGRGRRGRLRKRKHDVPGGLEPVLPILLQAVLDDVVESRRDVPPRLRQLRRLLHQDRRDRVARRFSLERLLAREHLVQDRPEGEDVGAVIDRQPPDLLGRHVAHRPHHRPRFRVPRVRRRARRLVV